MNEQQAQERRFEQAVQALREAQQHKCEAVWEFVQAREALTQNRHAPAEAGDDRWEPASPKPARPLPR